MLMSRNKRPYRPGRLLMLALISAVGCEAADRANPPVTSTKSSGSSATAEDQDVVPPATDEDAKAETAAPHPAPSQALVSSFDNFKFRKSPGLALEAVPEFNGKPQYLILAFGESTREEWPDFQLAMVIDQTNTYLDLNQNGDLTDSGEKFELAPTNAFDGVQYFESNIPSLKVGQDEHTDVIITVAQSEEGQRKLSLRITLWGWDRWTTGANLIPLVLGSEMATAPVIQLGGPLQMGSYREVTELVVGSACDFYSAVGTMGSAAGTFAAILNTDIPAAAIPLAEFEFPHRDSTEPVIRIKTPLTVRC